MSIKDFCILSCISGSSAYNPVERRMAPLTKDTSGVILQFDAFGPHLDASNKTIDMELEKKNFKAAGEILAEIWSESIINGHPIKARYVDPQERSIDTTEIEVWKNVHVQQSQYMLQIVKCTDQRCCKFRTNYLTYVPERFLPPPVPLKCTVDGLEISEGKFGSLFQAIFWGNMRTNALISFIPLCRRSIKKGKAPSKNERVGCVVNITQLSRL